VPVEVSVREKVPSIFRLARSTTVSFTPLSLVDFLRSAISADISVSFRRSSASRSGCGGSSGERGVWWGGDSYRRMKSTKTDGMRVVCLRTQIGATRPSGCKGEVGERGERGECTGPCGS
jgi:hypothetical protein